MSNASRRLVDSIKRYAAARGLVCRTYAEDWVIELARAGQSHFVYGYDLGINGSSPARLANDKAATADVLLAHGIAAIPHRVFLHPRLLGFVEADGNWAALLAAFESFGRDVVVKDNEGTGGMDVHRARTVTELEQQVHSLFQIARGIALAPFVDIAEEVRFVLLDGEAHTAYRKLRPSMTGDGATSLGALLARAAAQRRSFVPPDLDVAGQSLGRIPAAGEIVPLQWRHNLGRGSTAERLTPDDPTYPTLYRLARRATAAIGLRFASVDIVMTGGDAKILEINSGVMLEAAAVADGDPAAFVDSIYHAALDRVLAPKISAENTEKVADWQHARRGADVSG